MSNYLVYCLLGMAETDDQKVFLWRQWEQCFLLFDELLSPFAKTSFIRSRHAFVVPLRPHKGDVPGTRRITLKPVPLGRLRWSREDNMKWSQRPLQEDEYPIHFLSTQILSSNTKTAPAEIQIYIKNYDGVLGCKYNQGLTLTVCDSVQQATAPQYRPDLVGRLTPLIRAVRVGRTMRPWLLERRNGNITEASSLAGAKFTTRFDSLELDCKWQTWDYVL